jgi:hypothetical protein
VGGGGQALCHDIDHPGVSNEHLIKTGSGLALLYNDRAVLENHHTFTLFDLLRKPQYNILANLTASDAGECRKMMIACIMATDMKSHVALCSRLQATAFKFSDTGAFPLSKDSPSDREQLLEVLVHACDLSGQTMKNELAAEWGNRVLTEFIQQAKYEEANGVPVAPFMQVHLSAFQLGLPACCQGLGVLPVSLLHLHMCSAPCDCMHAGACDGMAGVQVHWMPLHPCIHAHQSRCIHAHQSQLPVTSVAFLLLLY